MHGLFADSNYYEDEEKISPGTFTGTEDNGGSSSVSNRNVYLVSSRVPRFILVFSR